MKDGERTLVIRAAFVRTAGEKAFGDRTGPPSACGDKISGLNT